MHVECPNCSTVYEVAAIHFVDGARRLRCTECGYRWNQTASEAELSEGKKSTPLLDMLEPAMNMEASAAINVDLTQDGSDEANSDAPLYSGRAAAADIDPHASGAAYEAIEDALAPLAAPADAPDQAELGRRWQWGLGVIGATVLIAILILGRQAVVSAAPMTQPLYRAMGMEPWSELRRWDLCVAKIEEGELSYSLTNTSTFRRLLPDVYVKGDLGQLALIESPTRSMRSGETIEATASTDALNLSKPLTLALATRADQSNARSYGPC